MAKNMVEAEQSLGSSRKKKPSAGETAIKMVKTIAEAAGILPKKEGHISRHGVGPRKSATDSIEERAVKVKSGIEQEKVRWAKAVEALKQGQTPGELEASLPLERARVRIESALSQNPTLKKWLLPYGEAPSSPIVAQVVTEIAESPLRDDANYLLMKGAQLNASLTHDDLLEGQSVLRGIRKRVLEMRGLPAHLSERAVRSMSEDQKRELLFIQKALGEIGTPAAGGAGTGLGGSVVEINATSVPVTGNEGRKFLDGLVLASGGEVGEGGLARDLAGAIDKELIKGNISKDDAQELRKLAARLREFTQLRGPEQFSTIYLSSTETEEIIKNPAAFFEKRLRNIESLAGDPQSSLFQANLNRLRLAGELFGSEYYDQSRILFNPSIDVENKRKAIARIHEIALDPKKKLLSSYVTARLDVAFAHNELSRSGDMKRFAERMRLVGDRGVNLVDASDGGLVGTWRGRYERILTDVVGENKRMSTIDEAVAKNIALEQFKAEKDLHQAQYLKFFQAFQAEGDDVLPASVASFDEHAMRSIINRAEFTWRLRMRMPVVMERGLGPGEGEWFDQGSSYQTLSIEEKMLGAARIRDWFIRKWGNKVEIIRIWNVGARFVARADHELHKLVKDRARELWHDLRLKGDAPEIIERRRKALERAAFLIKYNEPFSEVMDIVSPGDSRFEERITNRLRGMTYRDIEGYVELEEGGFRMQRLLRPYFYMDSGWRENTYKKFIADAYQYGDQYFLGAGIRQKGEAYFFNPLTKDRDLARRELMDEMKRVIQYRPQGLAEFLLRGGNQQFVDWVHDKSKGLGFADESKLFQQLNRRFLMINGLLLRENIAAIDYSKAQVFIDLSRMAVDQREAYFNSLLPAQADTLRNQWKHVEEVFRIPTGEIDVAEKYFSTMQRLHDHMADPAQLRELTKIQYDRFFLSIAWEDDIPIQYLEDPSQAVRLKEEFFRKQGLVDSDGKILPFSKALERMLGISQYVTKEGVGPGSPLARAWGDYDLAIQAFDAWAANRFGPDEQEFIKMITFVFDKVDAFQGPHMAMDGVLKLVAAWAGAAEVKVGFGELLTWMDESSVFKEVRGGNAPSLSLDRINEFLENIEKATVRLDLYTPGLSQELDDFLRLSTVHIGGLIDTRISWHSIFKFTKFDKLLERTENIPYIGKLLSPKLLRRIDRTFKLGLWEYKVRLAAAYAVIIVAIFAADQARKGGVEAQH